MPIFLTQSQLYRLLQRESPEGVYPDGAPSRFVSTAEMDSVAAVFGSIYTSMERVWYNLFPVSADESLSQWETSLLGYTPVGEISVEQRRANLLAFLRSQDNISYWTILNAVLGFVPAGTFVEIRQRAHKGSVIISQLVGTRSGEVWGPDWVAGDPAPDGVTVSDLIRNDEDELLYLRRHAYVYDVIIWGYALDSEEEARLDELLTTIEPARSDHTITSWADNPLIDGGPEVTANNVEQYENAKTDNTSGTGYRASAPFYFGFDGDDNALGFGASTDSDDSGIWAWSIE